MVNHETTGHHPASAPEEDAVTALRSLPRWARHPLAVTLTCIVAAIALFSAGRTIGALAARSDSWLPIIATAIAITVAIITIGVRLDRRHRR